MVSPSVFRFRRSAALAALVTLLLLPAAAQANEGMRLQPAPINSHDVASLQNGAKLFVNYCLNCHAAAFMRFNRLKDIGLTEQQIKDNMLFPTDKVGEIMKVSLDPKDAKAWFGANPPDLTVIARSRASMTRVPPCAAAGAASADPTMTLTTIAAIYFSMMRPLPPLPGGGCGKLTDRVIDVWKCG